MTEVFFDPVKLFPIPFHGASFWLSASYDATTTLRIVLCVVFFSGWAALKMWGNTAWWKLLLQTFLKYYPLVEFGIFLANGASSVGCIESGCNHGANLFDFIGGIWVYIIYYSYFILNHKEQKHEYCNQDRK